MALFKRKDLEAQGLSENQISWIMTEAQRALGNGYVLKSEAQEQAEQMAQKAREEAAKNPGNIQETEEYKALAGELAKVKTLSSKEFSVVKPKFRDAVWNLLDHEKPIEDQIPTIREQYEEYFNPAEEPVKNTPQYSRQPGPQKPNPTSAEDELYQKLKDNW